LKTVRVCLFQGTLAALAGLMAPNLIFNQSSAAAEIPTWRRKYLFACRDVGRRPLAAHYPLEACAEKTSVSWRLEASDRS
jgi:hypothetical protein